MRWLKAALRRAFCGHVEWLEGCDIEHFMRRSPCVLFDLYTCRDCGTVIESYFPPIGWLGRKYR